MHHSCPSSLHLVLILRVWNPRTRGSLFSPFRVSMRQNIPHHLPLLLVFLFVEDLLFVSPDSLQHHMFNVFCERIVYRHGAILLKHRSPGRADTKKKPTTHGLGPRDHEARPHSVLVPSVSTLTRDSAVSAPPLKKTTFLDLCVSSLRRLHAHFLCIVPREIHELCVSSLRQGRAIFTALEGLTPSWSRNFKNAQRPSSCYSRIMRVILAQGSCPVLQILDVSSRKQKNVA